MKSSSTTISSLRVLILPMRNGNHNPKIEDSNKVVMFLSYLWGMETRFNFININLFIIVLILPMRNGNTFFIASCESLSFSCSYPTYEEWKLRHPPLFFLLFLRSYPTYEEWKQNNIISIFYYCFRFLSYLWGMETHLVC